MRLKFLLPLLFLISAVAHANTFPGDTEGARNKDGSFVTGVLTAQWAPADGILPFPSNLLFLGGTDLTLNPPVADPSNNGDPAVALSGLDGFSTTERWVARFVDNNGFPGSIDPNSVTPQSVRVFQVTSSPTTAYNAVTGIVRELTWGVDFVAQAAPGGVLAIVPINPLPEYSTFMAVLTNDIRDAAGNDATPDTFYFLSKSREPWIDEQGQSTYALFSDADAQSLEQLRQITLSMELNAAGAGVNPDDIILAFTVQTQSITPTLKILRSIAQPVPVATSPTPFTTANAGGLGFADITIGIISLPYYLEAPSPENPVAPLTEFWEAEPGAYIPPFDQFPLDPDSTNLTIANPIPVLKSVETVPMLITVPNGIDKPPGGWPVVIYQHGITRNRTDMLAVADALASAGLVGIAIDQPLHGVVPEVEPQLTPFYIENSGFADFAQERTFDLDYWNNETGALEPDGITDGSGTSAFNLFNLRVTRDLLRQATADMSILAVTLQDISVDNDDTPDLDPTNVGVLVHSLGTTVGVPFMAIEPIVKRAYLNAATGSLVRTGVAGDFGERVNNGLASVGILPGTADYEFFLTIFQTVVDSGDGINWALEASMKMPIIHNQVQGDTTVPNTVPGAPVAGSEAINRVMSLPSYSTTQVNPDGVSGVARFNKGEHSSLFRPTFPDVRAEMQGQAASFLGSGGTLVNVSNEEVLVPVVVPGQVQIQPPMLGPVGGKNKGRPGNRPWKPVLQSRGQVLRTPGGKR